MDYRFVPECDHVQESHTSQFFSTIFAGIQFFKQGPAYKTEGPDPNKGSNQQ